MELHKQRQEDSAKYFHCKTFVIIKVGNFISTDYHSVRTFVAKKRKCKSGYKCEERVAFRTGPKIPNKSGARCFECN